MDTGERQETSGVVEMKGGEALLEALRTYGSAYSELGRRFAASFGLRARDSQALMEIIFSEDVGTPLTPARLSERIGLSSGATTVLVNRLENAGHVVRSREHTDRRVVTLRMGPTTRDLAEEFFQPLSKRLDRVLEEHSDAVVGTSALIADLAREVNDYVR